MANTLKLEIITAEGPAYSDDVETGRLCRK